MSKHIPTEPNHLDSPAFTQDAEQVIQALNSNAETGLTADQAKQHLEQYGRNKLTQTKPISAIALYLHQLKNPLLVVLAIGAMLSFYIQHYVDAFAITGIIFINATISFVQEYKAQKSMDALRDMAAPTCWVKRDGDWIEIPAANLVPGDLIKLETGTIIPADARLIQAVQLQLDESALTGESDPVRKRISALKDPNLIIGDQVNMAFMSTAVTHGFGTAIVTATGMQTQVGRIAELMDSAETRLTPLQSRIKFLSHVLIAAALLIVAIILTLGFFQGIPLIDLSSTGISLAVAAIPEGLPTVVTIVLTLGTYQMLRSNALIRHLTSVETLGSTTVICSDKTGTLTQNKMQVMQIWLGGKDVHIDGVGYEPKGQFFNHQQQAFNPADHQQLSELFKMSVLCSETQLIEKDGQFSILGLPTEGAIVVAAQKANINKASLEQDHQTLLTLPFDSKRKMMSVVVRDANNQAWLYVKGAPDVILKNSQQINFFNKVEPIESHLDSVNQVIDRYAQKALRTLAVGYRKLEEHELENPDSLLEKNLTFMGVFGIIDPPREEAITAVKDCHSAGISVVMITGDHIETAKAIAFDMGIIKNLNDEAISGAELNEFSDEDLLKKIKNIHVFARVTPEHKLRIVRALQANGEVVAMTGDGVNDAPALRTADIGIAMGLTGTDVAKESADLILLDDNFATIVTAVYEGRRIYDNIRKFIRQDLTANVGEVAALLFAFALISTTVDEAGNVLVLLTLTPLMILWVNLVSDGIPALALGIDGPEEDIMKRKPRPTDESFFANYLGSMIIIRGLVMGILTFVVFKYAIDHGFDLSYAQTLAFMTLIFAQLFHVFDARTFSTLYQRNPFSNVALLWAVAGSATLSVAMVYLPWGQLLLGTSSIAIEHLLFVIVLSALPTFILSGIKYFTNWKWL